MKLKLRNHSRSRVGRPTKRSRVGRSTKRSRVGRPTKRSRVGRSTKRSRVGRSTKRSRVGRPTKRSRVGRPTKRSKSRKVKKYNMNNDQFKELKRITRNKFLPILIKSLKQSKNMVGNDARELIDTTLKRLPHEFDEMSLNNYKSMLKKKRVLNNVEKQVIREMSQSKRRSKKSSRRLSSGFNYRFDSEFVKILLTIIFAVSQIHYLGLNLSERGALYADGSVGRAIEDAQNSGLEAIGLGEGTVARTVYDVSEASDDMDAFKKFLDIFLN